MSGEAGGSLNALMVHRLRHLPAGQLREIIMLLPDAELTRLVDALPARVQDALLSGEGGKCQCGAPGGLHLVDCPAAPAIEGE